MSGTRITPEQALFQRHLESGAYRSGVARKRWRLVSCAWPYPIFAVRATDEFGAAHLGWMVLEVCSA